MSPTAAKGRFEKVETKRIRRDRLVRHVEMMKWTADKGVVLPEGDADEAGATRVLHALRPLGVAMAGRDIVDPYKD